MSIFSMLLIGALGVALGVFMARRYPLSCKRECAPKLSEREQKIVALFKEKESIRNNDVEELLGVSDATATRALQALEDKGVIVQKGSGNAAHYIPKK